MQRILVFILFLLMLPFVFVYNILKGIGKLVTYPFRRLNNRVQDWSDLKLYERYGHRKFFFYSNINSRFVESNILPLIKGKFEVFFIDKNELDTWNEDIVLKSLIKNHFNKSKFPYLFRVEKHGYNFLSLSKGIKLLKEHKITQLQFEREIFAFFRDND